MITGEQIRAGRAVLKWSAQDLADSSGLGVATVRRLESGDGVPSEAMVSTLTALKLALEVAGIEFIGSPSDAPGVRYRKPLP
jgi:transcriptional regulator with XRE-family HTH domain